MATNRKVPNPYEYQYKKDYESDWDIHKNYINTFDPYEAMLIGQVYDSTSKTVDGAKITDSYASTLAIERAARVMGKLPDGRTEASAKADQGKAAFMDILRQKWIYPNANAQHSFKTKLRLWQLYSSVYGYMPMFYDWNISATGYVGPDCWLWNPRNLIPQQGRSSIKDMEYVTALTWVSETYLRNILDKETEGDGWNRDAVKFLLELVQDATTDPDSDRDTEVERTRISQPTKRGICLATRYEAGKDGEWITFAPDHSCTEVRRIKNPHKNGRIPFVIKYSLPLFDSFYGMGDFQRAKPLQFARDGLTNFYFKGIKMNLIPPIVANANGVVKHTLDYREGSVMLETIPNSVRRLETSNAGLSTYQAAQSALTGSLLSLYGSQNASIPGAESLNPSQGKTPAAIDLYSDKEATRDGQERFFLEEAIEELTDGMFSLVVNIGTEEIPVNLFSEDIEAIAKAGLEDVLGLFEGSFTVNSTETGGELRINPEKLKDVEYRFNITPGSTAKMNKDAQRTALEGFIGVVSQLQNVIQDDPNVQINWPQIMKAYENLSDIDGVSEFMTVQDGPTQREIELEQLVKEYEDKEKQEKVEPTVISNGMMFNDPHLAQAADAIMGQSTQSAPPQEPMVGKAGVYEDPTLGKAAEAISSL